MSPIGPKRIATPMLLGGHARRRVRSRPAAHARLFGCEFIDVHSACASAAKMCRSVMMKGLEALLTEWLLAARHYGVEDTVLDHLVTCLPADGLARTARRYMISAPYCTAGGARKRCARPPGRSREAGMSHYEPAPATRQDWAAAQRAVASRSRPSKRCSMPLLASLYRPLGVRRC